MIPSIILWLIGKGVPARFAKPLLIAVGVILLVAALGTAKCAYDRSIIRGHDAKQEAVTAKADRKADTAAADQRRVDDKRQMDERTNIKETVDEAHRTGADPRAAYYRCLGLQQDARRRGIAPPKC